MQQFRVMMHKRLGIQPGGYQLAHSLTFWGKRKKLKDVCPEQAFLPATNRPEAAAEICETGLWVLHPEAGSRIPIGNLTVSIRFAKTCFPDNSHIHFQMVPMHSMKRHPGMPLSKKVYHFSKSSSSSQEHAKWEFVVLYASVDVVFEVSSEGPWRVECHVPGTIQPYMILVRWTSKQFNTGSDPKQDETKAR